MLTIRVLGVLAFLFTVFAIAVLLVGRLPYYEIPASQIWLVGSALELPFIVALIRLRSRPDLARGVVCGYAISSLLACAAVFVLPMAFGIFPAATLALMRPELLVFILLAIVVPIWLLTAAGRGPRPRQFTVSRLLAALWSSAWLTKIAYMAMSPR